MKNQLLLNYIHASMRSMNHTEFVIIRIKKPEENSENIESTKKSVKENNENCTDKINEQCTRSEQQQKLQKINK